MRLIVLGDSFTHGNEGWADYLSKKLNRELVNLAERASSNELQVKLMQEFLLDNDIKNDIVIWQIGMSWRPWTRVGIENLEKVKRIDRLMMAKGLYHYVSKFKNKFDNDYRIDLLDLSPMNKNKDNLDEPQILQDMLFMFYMINKTNSKILIFRGQTDFISNEHWEILKELLNKKNIPFLEETLVDWCKQNNLSFSKDNWHPTTESYQKFCDEIFIPKLIELQWQKNLQN